MALPQIALILKFKNPSLGCRGCCEAMESWLGVCPQPPLTYQNWWMNPKAKLQLVGGLEHFLCFHILGIILPIDQYFSEGLKPPTRQISIDTIGHVVVIRLSSDFDGPTHVLLIKDYIMCFNPRLDLLVLHRCVLIQDWTFLFCIVRCEAQG